MKSLNIFVFSVMIGLLLCIVVDAKTPHYNLRPMKGMFYVHGTHLLDPPQNEPQNTHFNILLEGEAAQTLYELMNVKEKRDICLDDGSVTKEIKNMRCTKSKNDKIYECSFSIDILNQKIDPGNAC